MARQTDYADVVGQILAAELGAQADLCSLLEEFLLKADVAESAAGLVASGGQAVVELDAGKLHGEEVLLR